MKYEQLVEKEVYNNSKYESFERWLSYSTQISESLKFIEENNETGLVCIKNTPKNMAKNIVQILNNKEQYKKLQTNAWNWSKKINFEKGYREFINKLK